MIPVNEETRLKWWIKDLDDYPPAEFDIVASYTDVHGDQYMQTRLSITPVDRAAPGGAKRVKEIEVRVGSTLLFRSTTPESPVAEGPGSIHSISRDG